VFADLPDELRGLARAASLVPRFDAQLLAGATGSLVGDAERFCRQTLVTADAHPLFPYRLHDAVRAAVTSEPVSNPGAWSASDRTERAVLLLESLRQRSDQLLYEGAEAAQLDVLELAASLCHSHALSADWLATAITRLPGFELTAQRLPSPDPDTWLGQLSGMFEAWRDDRRTAGRVAYLEDFMRRPLRSDIRRRARLRLAYAHRTRGDHAQCLGLLTEALAEDSSDDETRYQVARTLHATGDYAALRAHLAAFPLGDTTGLRIRGDLAFDRGLLEEAIAGAALRAQYLRSIGQHRLAQENEVVCLWRRSLHGIARPEECDTALIAADRFGVRLLMRTCLAAKAICLAGDAPAVANLAQEADLIISSSAGYAGWREWTPRIIHALRCRDREEAERLYAAWSQTNRTPSSNYRLVDRLFIHAGFPGRYPSAQIDDESASAVDERWHAIIESLTT